MNTLKEISALSNIKPLIKWTGGKYSEFSQFAHLVPAFKNYYEPFFGGGGVFFALLPGGNAYLNDKSIDLISFYQLVKNTNSAFKTEMLKYAEAWEQATALASDVTHQLLPHFVRFVTHQLQRPALTNLISSCINDVKKKNYPLLFDTAFILDLQAFKNALVNSLADKFNRIKNIQHKEDKTFLAEQLKQHIETGVKSGLYLYLRSISNQVFNNTINLSPEKATANWYFVREFCYASMFRFNRKGEFNIPYGGIAYNRKNFRSKVDAIFSGKVQQLLKNATFFNMDFQQFLLQTSPTKDDFIFLDPPYDSEFSEYDQNTFTKEDQLRLRDCIQKCRGKCMLVIKETPFIRELYTSPHFHIVDFDKTYTYNVRGRNNRGTKHLIILNYQL